MTPHPMGQVLSTLAPGSPRLVVGVCVTSRYLGFAIVVEGLPVVLDSKRLAAYRDPQALARFVEGEVRDRRPNLVALVGGDELRRQVGEVRLERPTVELIEAKIA